jgi:hypothetical protein
MDVSVSGCDAEGIIRELLETGSRDEVVVLLFLSRQDAVLLSAIQRALTGGRYYASGTWTKSLVYSLIKRGLVRELNVTIRGKKYRLYTLTDCGIRVANILGKTFNL